MSDILKEVRERANLAGTNRLELLLFTLESDTPERKAEVYGINVFKVRGIMEVPEITRMPGMGDAVVGIVKIRDVATPIINLAEFVGFPCEEEPKLLIVTEYNLKVQGFLVQHVDRIVRLQWENISGVPPVMEKQKNGMVTAITEVDEIGLVQLLDVEKAIADISGGPEGEQAFRDVEKMEAKPGVVVFADDSSVARGQVRSTLEHMNLNYVETHTGEQCWKAIERIAEEAVTAGQRVSDRILTVLTDIEMPELDGFALTKRIKSDKRFQGVKVIVHSSLSGKANEDLGRSVGVDAYVAKFDVTSLSNTIARVLKNT